MNISAFIPYIRPTIQWSLALIFFIIAKHHRCGKIRILPSVFITVGIVFFALLSPSGKILLTLGSFKITQNALIQGLNRSSVLIGLLFFSQSIINSKIHFPGKIGDFISRTFVWYEKLTETKISFKPGEIIKSIDEHLLVIWNEKENTEKETFGEENQKNER